MQPPGNLEHIYKHLNIKDIPWVKTTPPKVLKSLIKDGVIAPCKTIDLGCGAGYYSIYMAKKGFEVTGVDSSETAIQIARENTKRFQLPCQFEVLDLMNSYAVKDYRNRFDFGMEWQVLHQIFPEHRAQYIANVNRLLNPDAYYLAVCFSEENKNFGGEGKYRKTPLDTFLYFSNIQELRELYKPYFDIITLQTIDIPGKDNTIHAVNYALLRKRKA
ncbi:class I SAM-dependent methyltransferase [Puteibacter caeruleilacunae]|nr:class I SAM-dependent methyltransferase [Puteibacter caeruleilacunae]